jgi:hypothetical protein
MRTKLFALAAIALLTLTAAVSAYATRTKSASCCDLGLDCCFPGSPCCAGATK